MLYLPLAKYSLNHNRIKVDISNDYRFRTYTTVYKRQITQQQSNSIYLFLASLYLDTLKIGYNNLSIYDATHTTFKISGIGIKVEQTTTYAYSTNLTDTLTKMLEAV